jgi:TatD DNase family protein
MLDGEQIAPMRRLSLVDAHVHLQDAVFASCLGDVLERASQQGVARWVCNGTREADWGAVARLAEERPSIFPCFGLHPWHVGERSGQWFEALQRQLVSLPSAIGEIGLDRAIEPRDERGQEEVFKAQLRLAREMNRPVMVHCVRAWGWLLRVLKEEPPPAAGLMIHAYSGSVELVTRLTRKYGAFFSVAGTVLDRRSPRQQAVLGAIPRDRLLLETDAPDLLPRAEFRPFSLPHGSEKPANEPANLRAILGGVAAVLGLSEFELAGMIGQNAKKLLPGFAKDT